MSIRTAILILSILLISCSDLGVESDRQVSILTDRESYSVGQSITIVTYNVLEDNIILSPCCSSPDFRRQQKINGVWSPPGYCLALCPSQNIPLNSGSNRVDTLTSLSTGHWRIMLRYQNKRTLRIDSVFSNEFTVQ